LYTSDDVGIIYPNSYFGEYFDVEQFINVLGNRDIVIGWKKEINNIPTFYKDTVYISKFDTLNYTIKM